MQNDERGVFAYTDHLMESCFFNSLPGGEQTAFGRCDTQKQYFSLKDIHLDPHISYGNQRSDGYCQIGSF